MAKNKAATQHPTQNPTHTHPDACPDTLPLFEERMAEQSDHAEALNDATEETLADHEVWVGDRVRYWSEGALTSWDEVLHDTIMLNREQTIVGGITISLDAEGHLEVGSNFHLLEVVMLLARALHEVTLDANLDPNISCLDGQHPASSHVDGPVQ